MEAQGRCLSGGTFLRPFRIMKLHKRTVGSIENRGAALLISILIGSIALLVGMGVYNRTYKELIFASFWKQAQIAFSSADAGLECAMYWDKTGGAPSCFGAAVSGWTPGLAGTFTVPVSNGCVSVTIIKNAVAPFTTIESRGRNTCDTNSLRFVERAVGIQY